MDRASVGDPFYVSLVWDGHGRRGDHKVPGLGTRSSWIEYKDWTSGNRRILCGQTETYSPHYATLDEWYAAVDATHFRRHPAGTNPTALPGATDWADCGLAITLNSSVGVDAVLAGVPTVTMDEGAMAWDVTSHEELWLRRIA